MLQTSKIEYVDGNVLLEGYCALDDGKPGKKPAVLIAHDWSGRNDFACQKAEQLAELGYVGFALDMFGNGKVVKTPEEKQAQIKPFMEDRALLRHRILAAYETVRKLDIVNTARIGAIGFCFGGLCALDLARSGAELRGVVSFHGLLNPAQNVPQKKIHAKVLVLHGHDDPMAPPAMLSAFENEMTANHVDWQVNIYGNTQHGFTNPTAHDSKSGIVYNSLADKRSWISMRDFFAEVFS
ncbi:MAG: dienelactone hydrolase family protein [Pseudomonadota bacterium]